MFSSRRRHTRLQSDWSSDVCSSDLSLGPLISLPALQSVPTPSNKQRLFAVLRFFAQSGSEFGNTAARKPNRLTPEIGRASCRERMQLSEMTYGDFMI